MHAMAWAILPNVCWLAAGEADQWARRLADWRVIGHNPPRRAQYGGCARCMRHPNGGLAETEEYTHHMATDYDAPRKTDDELSEDSIE